VVDGRLDNRLLTGLARAEAGREANQSSVTVQSHRGRNNIQQHICKACCTVAQRAQIGVLVPGAKSTEDHPAASSILQPRRWRGKKFPFSAPPLIC